MVALRPDNNDDANDENDDDGDNGGIDEDNNCCSLWGLTYPSRALLWLIAPARARVCVCMLVCWFLCAVAAAAGRRVEP